jgi:hypothetical protein
MQKAFLWVVCGIATTLGGGIHNVFGNFGGTEVPTVREILQRHFYLVENTDFRIHPHKGKGKLPLQ